jgi:hypothetical protein
LTNSGATSLVSSDIEEWITAMREFLEGVVLGRRYVCLDGRLITTDSSSIAFSGWHRTHLLGFVPQVAALSDPSVIPLILSNPDYWLPEADAAESASATRVIH